MISGRYDMQKQLRYLALEAPDISEKLPLINKLTGQITKLREEFMYSFPLEEEVAQEFLTLIEKINDLKNPKKEV